MAKFLIQVLIWGAFCFAFSFAFTYAVDPYNVFHVRDIRDNGVEPNKNYIKMSYVLSQPERFDSFVFGASRVGAIHVEKFEGERCYNMTYSAAMVWENLENVRTMLAAGMKIRKIYIGVDSTSYTADAEGREEDPMRIPYESAKRDPLHFLYLELDTARTLRSFDTILKHQPREGFAEDFYAYGWSIPYDQPGITPDVPVPYELVMGNAADPREQMEHTLSALEELTALCEKEGIELVVFVQPMPAAAYVYSHELYFREFLERLATITPYYNFSGFNDVTVDYGNYVDFSHYGAQTGDLVIACLQGEPVDEVLYSQGFGWYVTEDNIAELLEVLDKSEDMLWEKLPELEFPNPEKP
ncbi:MAG: hypothetical protein IK115_13930 [Lachnospiraceae bacterium]|nr:hypothetical protein [Lachnospiraceae bacterium]